MGVVVTDCTAVRDDSQAVDSSDPDVAIGTIGEKIVGSNA